MENLYPHSPANLLLNSTSIPDFIIAGIMHHQERKTNTGEITIARLSRCHTPSAAMCRGK